MRTQSNSNHGVEELSLSKKQRDLLLYLERNQDRAFNTKNYAEKVAKISRSYTYKAISVLEEKGLIKKNNYDVRLTKKGVGFLHHAVKEVKGLRAPTEEGKLSAHYLRYQLDIMDDSKFSLNRLEELHPTKINPAQLKNYTQYNVVFDDATVVIDKNTYSIRARDIVVDDIDEAHYKGFEVAKKYIQKLMSVGLFGDNMRLSQGHWARVESQLGKSLYAKFGKYKIELDNGSHFWVDNSPPHDVEDETDDPIARKNIDRFVKDVASGRFDSRDLNEIKIALSNMVQLHQNSISVQEKTTAQLSAMSSIVTNIAQSNEITCKNVENVSKLMNNLLSAYAPSNTYPDNLQGDPGYFG